MDFSHSDISSLSSHIFAGMIWAFLLSIMPLASASNHVVPPAETETLDSLTVYVFLSEECMICQFYTLELSRLSDRYRGDRIGFVGLFPNETSSPEKIDSFAFSYKIEFPLLQDQHKNLSRQLGIKVTPEVAVWDHRIGQMIYRGRIDDSYVRVGKRKRHPQYRDLEDMIRSWVSGQSSAALIQTQAIGCLINFAPLPSPAPKGE